MANRNNIRRYKKPLNINIGIVIFGMIFIYIMAFGVFRYFNKSHISIYDVVEGTLSGNNSFNAFAIRTEKLFNSDSGGLIEYYAREGTKVSYGEPIYTVDASGQLAAALESSSSNESSLSDNDFKSLESDISTFQYNYSSQNFNSVYNFKTNLGRNILEMLNLNLISSSIVDTSGFSIKKASEPGIIVYSYDGYEDVTSDSFTKEMLDEKNLSKSVFKSNENIESGANVYKLITDEDWYLVVQVDDETLNSVGDSANVEVHFIEDDKTAWASIIPVDKEDSHFLVLKLKNSVIRYATERFINVELMIENSYGLKIPASSILEKEFYTIPSGYITKGANSNSAGFNVEVYDEKGTASTEFRKVNISYSDDDYYYIEKSEFNEGDYIIKPESTDRYQIGAVSSLKGVYNINKGYAVFKSVDILQQNSEYCIVKSGTTYGLSQYDHIVLDSSSVNENDIIF